MKSSAANNCLTLLTILSIEVNGHRYYQRCLIGSYRLHFAAGQRTTGLRRYKMHGTYANNIYTDTHIVLDFDWFE